MHCILDCACALDRLGHVSPFVFGKTWQPSSTCRWCAKWEKHDERQILVVLRKHGSGTRLLDGLITTIHTILFTNASPTSPCNWWRVFSEKYSDTQNTWAHAWGMGIAWISSCFEIYINMLLALQLVSAWFESPRHIIIFSHARRVLQISVSECYYKCRHVYHNNEEMTRSMHSTFRESRASFASLRFQVHTNAKAMMSTSGCH